jgi:hypothetical protein
LGALGLVVNIIVLWNTIYIDAALAQLRQEGYSVRVAARNHKSPDLQTAVPAHISCNCDV